ncbi:hypothetical protein GCM10009786_06120 [Leucobacter alluvii]|uniref:LPXTG-motif cell wall-anchored protein n=2 Tax=Leucobacter alluvii TaxID=340321 RepID=A0ABP5MZA4_9MICO
MYSLVKFAGALALAALVLIGAAAPAQAADVITQETPSSVVVQVTGPGHPTEWDITARNTSSGTISPTLRFTEAEGALFQGAHPAQIDVTLGGVQLYSGDASGLVGAEFPLGEIPQNAPMTVNASVLLPYEAGDEYRTADAIVSWELSAFDAPAPAPAPASPPAPLEPGDLATTGGSALILLIAAVAAMAVLLGALLFLSSRRRESTAAES